MEELTNSDMMEIIDFIRQDGYKENEISESLREAVITKDDEGITVKYNNGAVDKYVYKKILVFDN